MQILTDGTSPGGEICRPWRSTWVTSCFCGNPSAKDDYSRFGVLISDLRTQISVLPLDLFEPENVQSTYCLGLISDLSGKSKVKKRWSLLAVFFPLL